MRKYVNGEWDVDKEDHIFNIGSSAKRTIGQILVKNVMMIKMIPTTYLPIFPIESLVSCPLFPVTVV